MDARSRRAAAGSARGAHAANTASNRPLRAGKVRKSSRTRTPLAQSRLAESDAASVLASLGSPQPKAASFAVRTDAAGDEEEAAGRSPRLRPPTTPRIADVPPTPSTLAILGLVAGSRENPTSPQARAPSTPGSPRGRHTLHASPSKSRAPGHSPQRLASRSSASARSSLSPRAGSPRTPTGAPATPQPLASPIVATRERVERMQAIAVELDRRAADADRPPALCGCRECVSLVDSESRSPYCSEKCQRREQNLRQGRVKCRIRDAEDHTFVQAQLGHRLA